MAPPSMAVEPLPSPFDSSFNLDDDSRLDDYLLAICKKIVAEADFLKSSMSTCICQGYLALNADLFGDSLPEKETPLSPSIYDESVVLETLLDESMVPETEGFASVLPETLLDESMVPETEGFASVVPETLLDESMVPETQGFASVVPETEGFEGCKWSRKRKVADAWRGPAAAETAAAKALEGENVRDKMLRILLPAYFCLVRSFP